MPKREEDPPYLPVVSYIYSDTGIRGLPVLRVEEAMIGYLLLLLLLLLERTEWDLGVCLKEPGSG